MENIVISPVFTCEHCGKEFSQQKNLLNHVKTARYCLRLRGEEIYDRSHVCEFCGDPFTQKKSLLNHLKRCEAAKIAEETIKTDKILQEKDKILQEKEEIIREKEEIIRENKRLRVKIKQLESHNSSIKIKIEKQKIKIADQQELISNLNHQLDATKKKANTRKGKTEGLLIGFDKGKVVNVTNTNTTNNIVKQKLAAVPTSNIAPLTIDMIKDRIEEYDYKSFMLGAVGVINFVKKITLLEMEDGTIEKNYTCTNRSRATFHRLIEDKNWKQDGGARYIHEMLNLLSPIAKKHMDTLWKEMGELPATSNLKHILMGKQIELQDLERGITDKNSEQRATLFSQIRSEIKDTNVC